MVPIRFAIDVVEPAVGIVVVNVAAVVESKIEVVCRSHSRHGGGGRRSRKCIR